MAGTPLLLVVLQGSFSSKMPRPSIKYLLIFLQCSYRRTSVSSAEYVGTCAFDDLTELLSSLVLFLPK
ncbi:hypothetical protein MANES_11G126510v8 [Manihot esculenta]|uniref:Uncharacterized protein n=1 Tax=Manihot esculenta TaxID=3983 RepID=A0ACB7H0F5_MANES|nr:hypothetical protein MANES_11G126510v8 [Manihot esculenta]